MDIPQRLSDLTERYRESSAARAYTVAVLHQGIAALSRGGVSPVDLARQSPTMRAHVPLIERAATAAALGTDQGLDPLAPLRTPWVDLVRRQTFIARMQGVRYVPPVTAITVVDAGISSGFVTENDPAPVVKPALTDATLQPGKLSRIVPYSAEAARKSADKLAVLVERDSARASSIGENTAMLDGDSAVAGGRPASILNGLSPLGGGSPTDIEADVRALLEGVRGGDAASPYFLTSNLGALYLARQRDNGARIFPDVTVGGGDIYGVPVLTSPGVADVLALVDADGLLVCDEGGSLDIATAAAFEFEDAPSAGAQSVISLFQTQSIAIRTERLIGWRLAWTDAAAYILLPVAD
jgi:hypothetical protein